MTKTQRPPRLLFPYREPGKRPDQEPDKEPGLVSDLASNPKTYQASRAGKAPESETMDGDAVPMQTVPAETAEDLQLDSLAGAMGRKAEERRIVRDVLTELQSETATIRFRQAVFTDLLNNPGITEALEALMPKIEELVNFRGLRQTEGLPILESLWRLGELELYVTIMDGLAEALNTADAQINSVGLGEVHRAVEEKRRDPHYRSLKRELPKLSAGIREKTSITLGINLDHYLRPVEAGIVSVNAERFEQGHFLSRLFGGGQFTTSTPLHTTPTADAEGRKLPLSPLFQDLEAIVKASAKKLLKPLRDYLSLHTGFLSALRSDFLFFTGAIRLYHRLQGAGLPVSVPEILPAQERRLHAAGLYNPFLLLNDVSEHNKEAEMAAARAIVPSDIDFDDSARLFVLTGPNLGGKTTFTRAVGICHIMAQAGIFVPARSCALSPADSIYTHFPSREEGLPGAGRLGEEAQKLAALFSQLSSRSLVLLNESLTSTSPAEGVYLARDILRGLRLAGARSIYTTHFHDLALAADEINNEVNGNSKVASLVADAYPVQEAKSTVKAENDPEPEVSKRREASTQESSTQGFPGEAHSNEASKETAASSAAVERTFRIIRRRPEGSSYARDIALRYGISYEQLRDTLQKRGLI